MDYYWIVWPILGVTTLTARLGLILYLSGASRAKNAASAAVRALADACVAILVFWAVGNTVAGGNWRSFGRADFFMVTTVLISTGAVVGATLGRTRLCVPLIGSALLAGLIVPIALRFVSSESHSRWLFLDLGGASTLHLTGGMCALAAAIMAGPRQSKYNQDGSANFIPGHNIPLMVVGAFAMVLGFMPQIAGYAVGQIGPESPALFIPLPASAMRDVLLASAAGVLVSILMSQRATRRVDVHLVVAGFVGGAVATSAGAGFLSPGASVLIGAVAGLIVPKSMEWLDLKLHIDDPSGFVAMQGAAGMVAAGVFVTNSQGRLQQLLVQIAGIIIIGGGTFAVSWLVFWLLRAAKLMRPAEADEFDGADLAEHDLNAYPDFQQTTIKSYHLRET